MCPNSVRDHLVEHHFMGISHVTDVNRHVSPRKVICVDHYHVFILLRYKP